MQLTVELPDEFAETLATHRTELEGDLREAIAVSAYRRGVLSRAQVGQLLGLHRFEVDKLFRRHHVYLDYTDEQIERDLRNARRVADEVAAERRAR